jgi:RimJ/RimL family protein N-acetyltransferase
MSEIRTERLLLRPFSEPDLPAFAAYRADPDVARFQSWEPGFGLADAREFLADQRGLGLGARGSWVQLAVVDASDGTLLGDVASCVSPTGPASAEIGLTFSPAARGRGYATEAVAAVVDALITEHDVHRVHAECDERNAAAHAVLGRLGFREEGRLVEADWFKGEWTSLRLYAVLAREWRRR